MKPAYVSTTLLTNALAPTMISEEIKVGGARSVENYCIQHIK